MALTHILGFPRIGAQRELKLALESVWRGEADDQHLKAVGEELRLRHWQLQQTAGLDWLTAGDFAYYDQMLNQTVLLGALPKRFGFEAKDLTMAQHFELARGNTAQPALEMTKWFDTNYHYLVPELDRATRFDGGVAWYFEELLEALALSKATKAVLIGPITYLYLAKTHVCGFDRLELLPRLIDAYARLLRRMAALGIEWVQIDEPALCVDLEPRWLDALDHAYIRLSDTGVKLLLATYFESTADIAPRMARIPVHGFHIDLVRAPDQLLAWQSVLPPEAVLSVGVVDGRNIWRNDLRQTLAMLTPLHDALADRLWIAPSCSLLHVPVSLEGETKLDPEIRPRLAFAIEKLGELKTLARALTQGEEVVEDELAVSDAALASRRSSRRVINEHVRKMMGSITGQMTERASPFAIRSVKQREILQLPLLPTTTIGSFPQTPDIRHARAAYKRKELSALKYLEHMRAAIRLAIERQEAIGLDVLVHGEAERNDMVEYFGEQLWGYAFTANGWVQSYGSRCVKPPIIYGDVCRPEPMTVDTAVYAQRLTQKPMKGMLTGPITMLQWSFVRDDQPRRDTAVQLALAIRDEVEDLEKAGIRIIQIDEPALREGLPLKKRDWPGYLKWAVHAFKLSSAVVKDETQIHTHMCYAEFRDILPSIAAMDADVITIETARSSLELLDAFAAFDYPSGIGPGVYDIHSPRVPESEAMVQLLERASEVIPIEQLWVNPDCGLKTRSWPETAAALANMVEAARMLREKARVLPQANNEQELDS